MAAEYPGAIFDENATGLKDATLTQAELVKIIEELHAGLVALGINPQGGSGTVAARLTAIEAIATAIGNTAVRNLVITNDSVSPSSKVTVTADLLGVEGSVLSNISLAATMTTAGLNGLDTGTEAASTWYSIWVGHNPTTDVKGTLLSTASARSGLTLTHGSLSGFTRWRRVGWVKNDASSNYLRFQQFDNQCAYQTTDGSGLILRVLNADRTTSMTAVACAGVVPVTSRNAHLHCITAPTGGTGALAIGSKSTDGGFNVTSGVAAAADMREALWMRLDASQQFFAKFTGTATGGGNTIDVLGYQDTL